MGSIQRRSGQRRSGLAAACGLLAVGGLTASASAQNMSAQNMSGQSLPDTSGKTVTIDIAGGSLQTVVGMLEQQTHIEALVRDGDTPFKLVNVHLEGANLPKALRAIASSARAKVSVNPDGMYVFEPEADGDSVSALPETPARQAPPADDSNPEAKFAPGDLQWRPLVLQHAVPLEILKFMHWDRDVVVMDTFKPVQLPPSAPTVFSTQANGLQQNMSQGGNPDALGYGNGYPSVPMGTGNSGPNAANYSQHRSADLASPDQAHQFPGGFGGGGGFGQGGFGGGGNPFQAGQGGFTPQPFQPGQRGAAATAALPTGVARIFALQSNNTLLVEATPDGYNLVKQIVKILDVAPRQVEVKVEFVTASVTDVDALGINFDLVPYPGLEVSSGQGSGTFGGTVQGVQPTFLQYATGNIVAQLFQTLTRTRGKVVQAPLITTTNNVEARIQIDSQIPFFTTGVVSNGGVAGGTTQSTTANLLTLSTGLDITPRINADDSITMNLQPVITDTTGQPAVGGIPPYVRQSLQTLRTVRSGDTMVLGGLVRKQESSSSQRIPILADIPYLGGLFRTRNKQVNDQELLIFVTPTIIPDSNDSGLANANGGQAQTQTVAP